MTRDQMDNVTRWTRCTTHTPRQKRDRDLPRHPGRTVQFRILHVCEFRDGKISRENVWLDVAAIMQQLAPAA